MADGYLAECPVCKVSIFVLPNELNCKIFRCGVFKSNGLPINPHLPKVQCLELVKRELIYGCGAAFTFDGTTAKLCDYI